MIGGERVKGRPCWMDDVIRRVVIGGEREKVDHVGFGRGVTSFMGYKGHVTCQIQNMGEESVTSRVFEKMNHSFLLMK